MKKIAVFYYTQSGQGADIARNLFRTLSEHPADSAEITVVYREIKPVRPYPFPWSASEFFDAFPECRLGEPPYDNEQVDISDVQDADLVVVVGQTWFLSPSLPIQAFFLDSQIRNFLKGKNIIFVNGCRNMWLMTSRKISDYIQDIGANFAGEIVLQDKHANLVSVLTIIRWLLYEKKQKGKCLPEAGVSEEDIRNASKFGEIIAASVAEGEMGGLQQKLMDSGAIDYKPSVLMLEKNGHRIFKIWAKLIRKKGKYGDPSRRFMCRLFYLYLLFVLYCVSPIGTLVYYLGYPLHPIRKQRYADCYCLNTKKKKLT